MFMFGEQSPLQTEALANSFLKDVTGFSRDTLRFPIRDIITQTSKKQRPLPCDVIGQLIRHVERDHVSDAATFTLKAPVAWELLDAHLAADESLDTHQLNKTGNHAMWPRPNYPSITFPPYAQVRCPQRYRATFPLANVSFQDHPYSVANKTLTDEASRVHSPELDALWGFEPRLPDGKRTATLLNVNEYPASLHNPAQEEEENTAGYFWEEPLEVHPRYAPLDSGVTVSQYLRDQSQRLVSRLNVPVPAEPVDQHPTRA